MVALMLWWPKCMEICLFRGGLSSKIAPAAPCFCFLNRGPGPFKAASEGPQTERSKNLRPGRACATTSKPHTVPVGDWDWVSVSGTGAGLGWTGDWSP